MTINSVSSSTITRQKELLEHNVRKSVIQCYVLEGKYPENLDYLSENYNLHYKIKNYAVHYNNLGDNLLPEISVFYTGN